LYGGRGQGWLEASGIPPDWLYSTEEETRFTFRMPLPPATWELRRAVSSEVNSNQAAANFMRAQHHNHGRRLRKVVEHFESDAKLHSNAIRFPSR